MSFLAPAQRGYESIAHSDLTHLPRVQMNSLPSFDNLTSPPPPPPHSVYHSNVNHHLTNESPSSDRSPTNLPKVGQTRCYWSLLSPELQFLYLDPVLASHLGEQADLLLGKSLLEFVHPDEQASAENDLGGVLKSRTLHGSVTRVRYSRLSRVRRQLGYQGPADDWPDANKIALDANYMAVDIVINWAADGLVLCFMHAVVDLTARDNDENNKTGWTNWCGTPYMSMEQVQLMYQQLLSRVPQPSSMTRVFQVLLNQPDRPLWMSWPPDPAQGHGPTSKDFARLAEDVQIGNSVVTGTDAKTSCTRRYKALQTMHYGGPQEVESIFIPYGSIIFACHRSNTAYSRTSEESNMAQSSHHSNQYDPPMSQQAFDPSLPSYSVPPPPPPNYGNSTYLSQLPHHTSSHYPSNNWSSASDAVSQQQYNQWASPDTRVSSSPTVSNLRSSTYPPPQHPQSNQWSSQPPYLDSNASSYSIPPPQGMPYTGSGQATMPVNTGPPSPANDAVPPSRIPRRGARDTYGNGGRGAGNPPVGINRCTSCKVTHSPEWRKGPSGKKDLCNACGLRFARSRARKEGATQRRRRERVVSPPTGGRPPVVSSNLPYPNVRRGYNEGNFAAGPPANEVFSQSTAFAGMTPSPSPPAGSNYAPYAQTEPHGEHRAHFPPPSSSTFYSLPPPNTPSATHHPLHGSAQSRLNPITPFPPTQLSPVVSPNIPPSSSPLNTAFGASSYEREKQRDRDQDRILLPPTPSTAHSRNAPVKPEYLSH